MEPCKQHAKLMFCGVEMQKKKFQRYPMQKVSKISYNPRAKLKSRVYLQKGLQKEQL